jgi:transcription elongation factor Elf1
MINIKSVDPKEIRIRFVCPVCNKDNWIFTTDYKVTLPRKTRCFSCKQIFHWRFELFTNIEAS